MKQILLFVFLFILFGGQIVEAEKSECSSFKGFEKMEGISCGKLLVPENHDVPEGRKITISYVILKAKSKKTKDDPIIYFSGGPGGSSLSIGTTRFLGNSPLNKDRDVILFDQRGINLSSGLPDIGPDIFQAMAADADIKKERKLISEVLKKYKQKARKAGIELGDYNSFQNARDVGEMMKKLGYKKYNLFGISYGTRLARLIQDLFPEKVKTVTLDSPNLMTDDFLTDRMKGYSAAAEKTFKACENDQQCRSKYPNLRKDYETVLKDLKKKPMAIDVDGEIFSVNAPDAMYFLRRRLYSNRAKEVFPKLIKAFQTSEKETIRQAVRAEKQLVNPSSFNTSMFLAVSTFESMNPANTQKVIDKMYAELPHYPAQLAFFTNLYIEGKTWHSKFLPMGKRKFNKSDVPTIIFVNQFDPVTPPENGSLFQKKLTKSHLFILDVGGHSGGDFNCKMKVMAEFMNDPKKQLDGSCLKLFGRKP